VPVSHGRVSAPSPDAPVLAGDRVLLRRTLLSWFDAHGRSLGFRSSTNPYGVLVAEVMAQQTQVSRVEATWSAFMSSFPTPAALATAPTADVVRAWAGLGYNRRAVNLQRAARRIVSEHGGQVPADPSALERLPGIGPYTARAVATIAFGMPVAAVDTNVRRVVTRLLSGGERAASGTNRASALSEAQVQAAADSLVDPTRPADWAHAMMDVGATLCRPTRIECAPCPLRPWCGHQRTRRGARGSAGDGARGLPSAAADRPSAPSATDRARVRGRRTAAARPFASTRRWLRGRLVALLCEAPEDAWRAVRTPLGEHSSEAVEEALAALVGEGLVERDVAGRVRLAR